MYHNGSGIRAEQWYRKVADQGFARAQSNLGFMYYNGNGIREDYAESSKWLRKGC